VQALNGGACLDFVTEPLAGLSNGSDWRPLGWPCATMALSEMCLLCCGALTIKQPTASAEWEDDEVYQQHSRGI